jgi:hypothetical protein
MTKTLRIMSCIMTISVLIVGVVADYYGYLLTAPLSDVVALHGGTLHIDYYTVTMWENIFYAAAALLLPMVVVWFTTISSLFYNEDLDMR